jgi:hypothetical protein
MKRDSNTNVTLINIVSKNPGPSDYNIKNLINGKGQHFISKFHNSPAPSMSPRLRDISRNNSK